MPNLTVKQAATELEVTGARVRQLCKAGRILGATKHGRDWIVPAPVVVSAAKLGRPPRPTPATLSKDLT